MHAHQQGLSCYIETHPRNRPQYDNSAYKTNDSNTYTMDKNKRGKNLTRGSSTKQLSRQPSRSSLQPHQSQTKHASTGSICSCFGRSNTHAPHDTTQLHPGYSTNTDHSPTDSTKKGNPYHTGTTVTVNVHNGTDQQPTIYETTSTSTEYHTNPIHSIRITTADIPKLHSRMNI